MKFLNFPHANRGTQNGILLSELILYAKSTVHLTQIINLTNIGRFLSKFMFNFGGDLNAT